MTPRTHTSSGNAVRTRRPMASPSSGTDQVGSPASSHSVGVPAAAGAPADRAGDGNRERGRRAIRRHGSDGVMTADGRPGRTLARARPLAVTADIGAGAPRG